MNDQNGRHTSYYRESRQVSYREGQVGGGGGTIEGGLGTRLYCEQQVPGIQLPVAGSTCSTVSNREP